MLFSHKPKNQINYPAFFGRPLAVEPARLEPILQSRFEVNLADFKGSLESQRNYQVSNGVAIIDVSGALVSGQLGWIERLFGMQSYDEIERDFLQASRDPSVTAVLFKVNSPGGEAGGMFDLSAAIYKARGSKPIWAIANEEAFSAAYGIASAADKVYVTRTGGVGSVGVIAVHMETSEQNKREGHTYSIFRAGEFKAEQNSLEPLTDHARGSIQAEVNRIYSMFIDQVARNRGMSKESILKTKAGIFFGEGGVLNGFADAVSNVKDVLAELQAKAAGNKAITAQEDFSDKGLAAPIRGSFAVASDQPKIQTREEITKILEICALAHRPEWGLEMVNAGITPDQARTRILNRMADEDEATQIDSRLNPFRDSISQSSLNTREIYENRKRR
jgi:capsid assembly protease